MPIHRVRQNQSASYELQALIDIIESPIQQNTMPVVIRIITTMLEYR